MNSVESVMLAMQLILTFGNVCIMMYAFRTFLKRPQKSMEERIAVIENKVKEIDQSLNLGNDKFRNQERTNEVLIHSTLALIEFEIQYCLIEHKDMSKDLEKAKEDLHAYLAKK